jgi:hypothetical protein
LNEYFAVRVIGSPLSSIKYELKGILKLFPKETDAAAGIVATLGAALVILSVKVDVKLDVKLSYTVIVIT